jgi:hypothetical protein
MNRFTKNGFLGLAAGALLFANAVSPVAVHAAQPISPYQPGVGYQQMDPGKIAQNIADTYGVNKDEVMNGVKEKVHFKDLTKAALIAKAGGKSFAEVMQAKTFTNSWRDVAKSLGVTREQMRTALQDIAAGRLQNKLNIPRETTLGFLKQGYRVKDIAMAGELSKNTGKPEDFILSMKQINNTWLKVAQNLGVSKDTFRQDLKEMRLSLHQGHRHFQGERMAE